MRVVWAWLSSRSTGLKANAGTITALASLVGIVATIVVLFRGEDGGGLNTSLLLDAAVSRVEDAGSSRVEIRAGSPEMPDPTQRATGCSTTGGVLVG